MSKNIIKNGLGLLTGFLIFELFLFFFYPDDFILSEGNEDQIATYLAIFVALMGGMTYSSKKSTEEKEKK
ncbi:MAG TPA: hypothetical protein VF181_11505 [Balneolaceae bacterium]